MNTSLPDPIPVCSLGRREQGLSLVLYPTPPVPAVALSEQFWQQNNWKTLGSCGMSGVMEMEQ